MSTPLCLNCGKPIDADARFCKFCAHDITQPQPTIPTNPPKGSRTALIVAGGLVAFCAIALAIGLYIHKHNQAQAVVSVTPTPTPAPTMGAHAKEIEAKVVKGEDLAGTDLAGLSAYELRVIRNAAFARHGRKYDRPGLGDYYVTCSWYKPRDDYKDTDVTQTDKNTIDLIVTVEKSLTSPGGDSSNNIAAQSTPLPTPPQSSSQLTRDTILAMMRGKYSIPVKAGMSDQTGFAYMVDNGALYAQMIAAKALVCKVEGHAYSHCVPGPNNSGLYISTANTGTVAGYLSLNIGYKVPSSVTGVSQVDQATAYADVVFSLEPSSSYAFYQKYQSAFRVEKGVGSEQHRAVLRLYDDGWRVERVN
jgi:hypothetical protein